LSISKILRVLVPGVGIGEIFRAYATRVGPGVDKQAAVSATELLQPNDVGPLIGLHKDYLIRRRFDPEALAHDWGLRAVGPFGGDWAWRLLIPIYDQMGAEVSYTSRALSDARGPRYLTLSNEKSLKDPRSLLYGEQHVQENVILVVEGPSDVWRIGRGAVATLGTSWTKEQAEKLRKYKTRLIMFDNERPAQKLARKLAAAVASAPGTTEIITGLVTDPGDLTPSEVAELRMELGL